MQAAVVRNSCQCHIGGLLSQRTASVYALEIPLATLPKNNPTITYYKPYKLLKCLIIIYILILTSVGIILASSII